MLCKTSMTEDGTRKHCLEGETHRPTLNQVGSPWLQNQPATENLQIAEADPEVTWRGSWRGLVGGGGGNIGSLNWFRDQLVPLDLNWFPLLALKRR